MSPFLVDGLADAWHRASEEDQSSAANLCGICRRLPPPYARAIAYGGYDGNLRSLIHLLKYDGVHPAATTLGRMLATVLNRLEASFEPKAEQLLLISVPLHRSKRWQRGFNQSESIVRAALKQVASPNRFELRTNLLVRQRATTSQIGLTRHQRRRNLRGAFAVIEPGIVAGRDVILVDDVLTTGTTASECARVLRRAGAARVHVATVARTLKLNFSWEGASEQSTSVRAVA